MSRSIFALSLLLSLVACNTPKVAGIDETVITEQRQLDTLYVTAPAVTTPEETYSLPTRNPSAKQVNDLLHTRLDLRFDWEEEQVIGQAQLSLKPYFYPVEELTLDAKMFEFKRVALADGTSLNYTYDDQKIQIELDRVYTRKETYDIHIDYIATPRADGGSDAITSDKGLFFINPRGEDPNKPKQIWTQGETENNSRWFPTIDKPNERCTQEMYITVEDNYVTLSNGAFVSSEDNKDGTRTDYWKMDMPHAPYLFMLTVGEFAVVEDTPWNGIPVNYYVEPEFEKEAKAIFPHTPEMLGFFSDVTGVSYPWQKYSQIVVRDYVSGAMENTTGVIFGEFMQKDSRALIDELINDKIVAHEMMHHWFGDYVTCENWANLTLNEGFANYSEYLWLEHKFGRDEADYHMLEEWGGYLSSAQGQGIHPLIHYGYGDKEDMFDAHSYNKGGSVLHMLRNIVGDDAFFAAWQKYLEDNAFSAVEVDELRMAFEDITGQDLQWFFNQWFHEQGHPSLQVDYGYDDGSAIINVVQTQDAEEMPAIFQLPVAVDIYLQGQQKPVRKIVEVNEREQTFRIPVSEKPALIIFDADRNILAEWEDEKTNEELVYQFKHAPRFLDRFQAITQISDPNQWGLISKEALEDDFHGIRQIALERIYAGGELSEAIKNTIYLMAETDEHSEVRSSAIRMLVDLDKEKALASAEKALDAQAYNVMAAGLETIYQISPEDGIKGAKKLEREGNPDIIAAIGTIYAAAAKPEFLPYFEKNLSNVDEYAALDFYDSYAALLVESKPVSLASALKTLEGIGTDNTQSPWRRFASIRSLSNIGTTFLDESGGDKTSDLYPYIETINAAIANIKAKETNPQLRGIYQQY